MRILLLGASGTLGVIISKLLVEHIDNVEIITASRTQASSANVELCRFQHRRLDLNDPRSFSAALQGINILIHAAGPFNHDPTELLQLCLRMNIHYIDIAEDREFINKVQSAANDVKNSTACVISGCSTLPALVSLLSEQFDDLNHYALLRIYLNMGSRNRVSHALLYSLCRPLGRKLSKSIKSYHALYHQKHHDQIIRSYGRYPHPLSSNDINIAKSIEFYVGFDRHYVNRLLQTASYLTPNLSDKQLSMLLSLTAPVAKVSGIFGSIEGHLLLEATQANGESLASLEITAKEKGIQLPAAPVIWAVSALKNYTKQKNRTVLRLNDLIDIQSALDWIRTQGYQVSFSK